MKTTVILLCFLWISTFTNAQSPDLSFVDASHEVTTSYLAGDTLYLGGRFAYLGSKRQGMALIDTQGKALVNGPLVNSSNSKAISDGQGGWVIINAGGTGQLSGGVRILSNGQFIQMFPFLVSQPYVERIGHLVYICGFSYGTSANSLVVYNLTSNTYTTYAVPVDGFLSSIHVTPQRVYIGGSFTTAFGQPRKRLIAFNRSNLLMEPFSLNIENGMVRSITELGDKLYLAGTFTIIGGISRNFTAAFDKASGALLTWNPNPSHEVRQLLTRGERIYLAGTFNAVGGLFRNKVAAVDTLNGACFSWQPALGTADQIRGIKVFNNRLVVYGAFRRPNLLNLAWIDEQTGAIAPFTANPNAELYDFEGGEQNAYMQGNFGLVNGFERKGLGAVNINDGSILSWNPAVNADPYNLYLKLVYHNGKVYVGGEFSDLGQHMVELDAHTGQITLNLGANDRVNDFEKRGNDLFIVGQFTAINGRNRSGLARFDLVNRSVVLGWSPIINGTNPWGNNSVALAGNKVYFSGISSITQSSLNYRVRAVNISTGLMDNWSAIANGKINFLQGIGNAVYVGGDFSSIDNAPRVDLACFDANTNQLRPWNAFAAAQLNFEVSQLYEFNNLLNVSGAFNSIGGLQMPGFASLDTSNAWAVLNPVTRIGGSISAEYATASTSLLVGSNIALGNSNVQTRNLWKINGIVAGVQESKIDDKAKLDFYPNPTTDFILVNQEGAYKVEIYDAKGSLVARHELFGPEQIDLSQLKAGSYVLRLSHTKGQTSKPLIKQ